MEQYRLNFFFTGLKKKNELPTFFINKKCTQKKFSVLKQNTFYFKTPDLVVSKKQIQNFYDYKKYVF